MVILTKFSLIPFLMKKPEHLVFLGKNPQHLVFVLNKILSINFRVKIASSPISLYLVGEMA